MSVHLNCPVYSTPTLAITIIFTQGSICPRPKRTEGIMFEIKSNNYDRKWYQNERLFKTQNHISLSIGQYVGLK